MYKRVINKIRREVNKAKKERLLSAYNKEFERMANDFKNTKNIKLHFGCGPRILKGWVNIDISFQKHEDYLTEENYPPKIRGTRSELYILDITETGLPFNNNSVDVIFHEDFIEHLSQKEQVIFFAETYRVLKPGGIHRVNTPDLIVSMENSNFQLGKKGVYEGEWTKHGHLNIFTKKSMEEMISMIGYKQISFNSKNKSESKEIPVENRPGSDRPLHGNIFADIKK